MALQSGPRSVWRFNWLEGHRIEIEELRLVREAFLAYLACKQLSLFRPHQPPTIELGPLPIGIPDSPVRWKMVRLMFIPVTTLTHRRADLGVRDLSQHPSGDERLLEDIEVFPLGQ